MKILKNLSGMFVVMAAMSLFGCGGGGSSSPPTKAKLTLLSQSATAGTKISTIEVTVELQPGVTVKANTSTTNSALMETAPGVVVLSGVTATAGFLAANANLLNLTGIYTPAATATSSGTVKIIIPSAIDFDPGEYVTINADIAVGTVPVATGFKFIEFKAFDINGAVNTSVTSSIVPAFN